jgi:hypothetical protein
MKGVPGDYSRPLVEARCTGCAYVGKSRYPETYRCTACYYTAKARADRNKAKELIAKAAELKARSKRHWRKVRKFRARHPEAGMQGR